MKYAWLNLVLRLTNQIFGRKQRVLASEGPAAVLNVFILIFFEVILAVISLPLYLNLKTEKITAYLEEKGGYAKINFDYNLRRIITLTGVGVIAVIWIVKLLLIILVPVFIGDLRLYNISELSSADLLSVDESVIGAETTIQTARITSNLEIPELTEVKKSQGRNFIFYGQGQPNSTVVLLLSDLQTAVYLGEVDAQGNWEVEHEQSDFALSEGNHSVLTFTLDRDSDTRSEFSNEQYFKVETTWLDVFTRNVDTLANWSVMVIILVGAFLTLLTI